jgi:hypothetical protein
MKVIEEHRNDQIPPKNPKYIYKCYHCGSILEVEKSDIQLEPHYYEPDIIEYFVCPVCKRRRELYGLKLFHRKGLRKIFNKKYR